MESVGVRARRPESKSASARTTGCLAIHRLCNTPKDVKWLDHAEDVEAAVEGRNPDGQTAVKILTKTAVADDP